jgi:hypothetical protein
VKLKRHDRKFGDGYVMTKSRKDLKMGDKWKKSMGVSEEVEATRMPMEAPFVLVDESELTESTTTDKKNTFGMAPFKDLKNVADAALKIMTRQPQEVKEEEKEEVTKEDQPQTLTEQIV